MNNNELCTIKYDDDTITMVFNRHSRCPLEHVKLYTVDGECYETAEGTSMLFLSAFVEVGQKLGISRSEIKEILDNNYLAVKRGN